MKKLNSFFINFPIEHDMLDALKMIHEKAETAQYKYEEDEKDTEGNPSMEYIRDLMIVHKMIKNLFDDLGITP